MVTRGLSERHGLRVVHMSATALRYAPRPEPDPTTRRLRGPRMQGEVGPVSTAVVRVRGVEPRCHHGDASMLAYAGLLYLHLLLRGLSTAGSLGISGADAAKR